MSRPGIVMVIARFTPAIGGTENQCRQLARTLATRGYPITVITERFEPSLSERERMEGFEILRLSVGKPAAIATLSFGRQLYRWLKRHPEYSIIHAHMLAGPSLAALVVGRLLKKTVLLKAAGAGATGDIGTARITRQGRFKLNLFKKLEPRITCPSPLTREDILQEGFPRKCVQLVPNGVDTDYFKAQTLEAKSAARKELGWPQDRPVALYVGRWAPGKGVETLLEVWEKLAEKKSAWQLRLVIDRNPTAAELKRLEALKTTVVLSARIKDPRPYYQASDVAILLSTNEGLSNFLLEAMASGVPVISTPAAAVQSAKETHDFGWVLESEGTDELVTLLTSLEADPSSLPRKGEKAREKAVELFSIASVATTFEGLYKEVAS